ncbi:MAG: MerR family transcriptional regulator [Flavobacterium sp.]|nr:MerR family transcriptional regulator [Pedobacter sp.]
MNLFSISQLSQFSGIKPHTIRVWEQRYNALKPSRSEGNTRYYDNVQLRRLLNIVSLMNTEFKVSELCVMPDEKLFELINLQNGLLNINEPEEYFVSQLVAASLSYDEGQFEKVFSHCLLRKGMKETYTNVIYPLLIRIGLMWSNDTAAPAHEHFISNLIKQKLYTVIDSLPVPKHGSIKWLLFLPENEHHDIGLLFANYLIRFSGQKVIYLGNNVPLSSLKEAVKDTKPDNLLFLLVHHDFARDTQNYLNQLNIDLVTSNVFIAGNQKLIGQLNIGNNIKCLKSVEDLSQILIS